MIVLAVLKAEEVAPTEQERLRVEQDGVADIYMIDRLKSEAGPARIHLVKNPGPMQQELISIDGFQWLRTETGWERSPVTPIPAFAGSAVGLFRDGLTDLVDHEPRGEGDLRKRRFSARITWTNGGVQNAGRLSLAIDASGRPSAMFFDGRCGTHACRFRQLFDYNAPVVIEQPLP
jgi:hypothetical protein